MLTKLCVGYDLCVGIPISRQFSTQCQNRFLFLIVKAEVITFNEEKALWILELETTDLRQQSGGWDGWQGSHAPSGVRRGHQGLEAGGGRGLLECHR